MPSPYASPLTPALSTPATPATPTLQNVPDWLLRRNLPGWIRQQNPGADDGRLTGLYRNFLNQNPNAPGAGRLVDFYTQYLRRNPNAPGNAHLHTFGAGPSAGGPIAGGPTPAGPAPGAPPGPIAPPNTPAGPLPPAGTAPRSPGVRDIYDVYLSTIPAMNEERDRQISGAMASAGFSGNRYGTAAMRTAGQIGAETALRQNQLLNQLLYSQNEADANRALQATAQGMQWAGLDDQMQRARLDQLFGFGRWEQGRMDDYARLAYQDFESNKYGLLPLLIQFAGSQSGGSAATPYAVQQPGGTGAADWITLLAGLLR